MNLLEVLNTDNLILDVDYDFFFNSEAQISDFPWKEVSDPNQLADFLHHYRDLKFEHIVAHDEALPLWVDKGIVGATCIHIDHHHDWYINPEDLNSQSLGSLDGVINCGNYAAIAAKAGIIKNYIWVYPDHYSDFNEIVLPRSLAISGVKVKSYPYSEYKILIEPYIDIYKIKMAIMCLSPDFIPEKEIRRYFDLFKSDNEFRYRALDYAYEVIISDRLDPQRKYFRLNLSEEVRTIFHCSPTKNLTLLSSPSDVVHVSPSLSFAACYAMSPESKKGWIQGIDQIADKQETVYLIHPIDFQMCSFAGASMYSILKELKHLGKMNCCNHDFMIQAPLQVTHEQNINDLNKYFYDHKVHLVNHNAIIDMTYMRVSKKIQKDFSDWMSLSWDTLILLKSTPFFLMLFTELRTEKCCIDFFPLVFWQRLASRCLYPLIPYELCTVEDDGYHGLSHGLDVGLKCIIYGTALGIPTTTLFLSALCHDLVKQDKEDSLRSSEILFNLLNTVWSDYSSVSNNAAIEAINEHSRVTPTKNILSMVLRDADRARLAWERGFVARYFTTDIGTEIALNGANFYGELQRRLMFSENVRLEIYPSDIATEVILCYLGRRYVLESSNEINSGRLNYFISIYNVSELIIFAEQLLSCEIINNLLINASNIHYVNDLSVNINFLLTQDLIKTPLLNIIYIARALDFMTKSSLNSILLMPVKATIHLELCIENINWVIANLAILASREVILVYSINPSVDKGKVLNLIVDKILEEKHINPEAINLRIIFVYSWCWIEQPEDAITAFSLARNNYSPLSAKTATRFSNDIFKNTLEDVRRRRERCHECSLAINCLSSEYASTSHMPIEIPVHFDRFQKWQPYAAD